MRQFKQILHRIITLKVLTLFLLICGLFLIFFICSSKLIRNSNNFVNLQLSSVPNTKTNIKYSDSIIEPTPRQVCKCLPKFSNHPTSSSSSQLLKAPQSTCSTEATAAGPNQTVIAYTFYRHLEKNVSDDERDYFGGIERNIDGIRQFYPGALTRLYSNISLTSPLEDSFGAKLCTLICDNQDIFFYCPIQQIKQFAQLHLVHPMLWRFLPLGDSTVHEFHSRDLDSRILQREVDAVKAWRESKFAWHGMRDHPQHCVPLLGGVWGGNNERIGLNKGQQILAKILQDRQRTKYGVDQQLLARHIYNPYHRTEVLSHDSYCCIHFKESRPFPSQRRPENFHVGQLFEENPEALPRPPVTTCDLKCRPPGVVQGWKWC